MNTFMQLQKARVVQLASLVSTENFVIDHVAIAIVTAVVIDSMGPAIKGIVSPDGVNQPVIKVS